MRWTLGYRGTFIKLNTTLYLVKIAARLRDIQLPITMARLRSVTTSKVHIRYKKGKYHTVIIYLLRSADRFAHSLNTRDPLRKFVDLENYLIKFI